MLRGEDVIVSLQVSFIEREGHTPSGQRGGGRKVSDLTGADPTGLRIQD